jgi:hypothetical protein
MPKLAGLADVLAQLPEHSARRLDEFFPWHWKAQQEQ